MLSAHGGEIFIHTLHVSRSCLEDLPSVLESVSGKVTDYRINDFASIIHNFKLIPLKQFSDRLPDRNLTRLRAKFSKVSKYFPLTAGSTIVFNVRQVIRNTIFTSISIPHPATSFVLSQFFSVSLLVFGTNAFSDRQGRNN